MQSCESENELNSKSNIEPLKSAIINQQTILIDSIESSTHKCHSISKSLEITNHKKCDVSNNNSLVPSNSMKEINELKSNGEIPVDSRNFILIDNSVYENIKEKKMDVANNYINEAKVLFTESERNKKANENRIIKKKTQRKPLTSITKKNKHIKCKIPRKHMKKKLRKYYEEIKSSSLTSKQNQKIFKLNSKHETPTKVKKSDAKENLFEGETSLVFSKEEDQDSFQDDETSLSSPSTIKGMSFISCMSNNTIVFNKSETPSIKDYFFNTLSSTSVVTIPASPFMSDELNVAIVQVSHSCKPNIGGETNNTISCTRGIFSTENFLTEGSNNYLKLFPKVSEDEISVQDKVCNETEHTFCSEIINDSDTFVMANTSSDFNKTSKDLTITPNSETVLNNSGTTIYLDKVCPSPSLLDTLAKNKTTNQATLLETLINIYLPQKTQSTSNENYHNKYHDNDNLITSNHLDTNTKGILIENKVNKGSVDVFKRPYDNILPGTFNKNLNLPNENTIAEILKETEKIRNKSCADDMKNLDCKNITELWQRLTLVLELSIKRLEDTLVDKIIKELQKTLPQILKESQTLSNVKIVNTKDVEVKSMSNKERVIEEVFLENECLQCNLVQNEIIDDLMKKFSFEREQSKVGETSNLNVPKLISEHFEKLKTQNDTLEEIVVENEIDVAEPHNNEQSRLACFVRMLANSPVDFVRQNATVVSSVPTFFIFLFVIYGILMLVMKPLF